MHRIFLQIQGMKREDIPKIRGALAEIMGVWPDSIRLDAKTGQGSLLVGLATRAELVVEVIDKAGFPAEALDVSQVLKDVVMLTKEGRLALQQFLPVELKACQRGFLDIDEGCGADDIFALYLAMVGPG